MIGRGTHPPQLPSYVTTTRSSRVPASHRIGATIPRHVFTSSQPPPNPSDKPVATARPHQNHAARPGHNVVLRQLPLHHGASDQRRGHPLRRPLPSAQYVHPPPPAATDETHTWKPQTMVTGDLVAKKTILQSISPRPRTILRLAPAPMRASRQRSSI